MANQSCSTHPRPDCRCPPGLGFIDAANAALGQVHQDLGRRQLRGGRFWCDDHGHGAEHVVGGQAVRRAGHGHERCRLLGCVLGRGAFGTVVRGTLLHNGGESLSLARGPSCHHPPRAPTFL